MATGTVQCPNCGGQFSVDSSMAMQNVRCPHCGESIYLEGFENEPQREKSKSIDGLVEGYAAPQSSKSSRSIEEAPRERPKVFLHLLLISIVAILVAQFLQMSRLCEHMSNTNDKLKEVDGKLLGVTAKLEGVTAKLEGVNGELQGIHGGLRSMQVQTMAHLNGNRIIDCKLISYTWEYPSLMENEFRAAILDGYEPAGYVCQNSIKGGFFLLVKRSKWIK